MPRMLPQSLEVLELRAFGFAFSAAKRVTWKPGVVASSDLRISKGHMNLCRKKISYHDP